MHATKLDEILPLKEPHAVVYERPMRVTEEQSEKSFTSPVVSINKKEV